MKKYIASVIMLALISSMSLYAKKGMGPEGKMGPGHHQMGGPEMGMGPGFLSEPFLEKIGVSDENRKKIRAIQYSIKKEMMDTQFQIHEKMISMKKEYEKADLDESKIKEIAGDVAELRKKQQLKLEYSKIEIMKILTVDQRKKVMEFAAERMERFKGKMRGEMGGNEPQHKKGPKGHENH